jgi:hypothetical protein
VLKLKKSFDFISQILIKKYQNKKNQRFDVWSRSCPAVCLVWAAVMNGGREASLNSDFSTYFDHF